MELSSSEFGHVILFENTHALFDLWWNCNHINFLESLVLGGWVSTLIRPVPSGEHLDVQVNREHLVARTLLEVLHSLL